MERGLASQGGAGKPRLVLLTDPRLFDRTCWILESHRQTGSSPLPPSPALFTALRARVGCGGPGQVLVLHGCSPQVRVTTTWLEGGDTLGPVLPVPTPTEVEFGRLEQLFGSDGEGQHRPLRLPDKQVLRGLLAGAALLRSSGTTPPAGPLAVVVEDYRAVYAPSGSPRRRARTRRSSRSRSSWSSARTSTPSYGPLRRRASSHDLVHTLPRPTVGSHAANWPTWGA